MTHIHRIALAAIVLVVVMGATAQEPDTDIKLTMPEAIALVGRLEAQQTEIDKLKVSLAAAKLKSGCI